MSLLYTFKPSSHYSSPSELLRKLKFHFGDFDYRWTIDFTESCWFDKSKLGEDALDWNFKLCGITAATTFNNRDSVICAGRPDINVVNTWQVVCYINDSKGGWNASEKPITLGINDPLIVTMSRKGKQLKFNAYNYNNADEYITETIEVKNNLYRFIGPYFGGNRKPPHNMDLYVDFDKIKYVTNK